LGGKDSTIRVWELDESLLLGQAQKSVHYTTAKLVLVGDSGVGKTGLGYRLAHNEFKEHASTHGQQFWVIDELGKTREDGTQCEAVLWDLAGQHVYRSIHSIFLDHVNASLVLFDPSNRQDPLKGAEFWLEQLKGNAQLPPSVLVGARVDRGAPALSQQDLDQFCQRYGISGGYISTSAMTGDGLPELLERLKAQIPWDEMTTTVTTVTFKRIKDYVLALKEQPDRKNVLVSPTKLRALLETSEVSETSEVWEGWTFTDAEMMTAVGHLENHGYVCILRSSAGEQSILLKPELLVGLAASIVLQADKHPRELGAINEAELLKGNYAFDEIKGLEPSEQQLLLDAAVLRFLEHSICFRETLDADTLLIFPALIKQKRPLQDDTPFSDDISYIVRGRVENIYATLVVLLGYTPSFLRINHWQNQAQYEMDAGQICGFRMLADREGEIELVLYYGNQMPSSGRTAFQTLFEQFLYQREVEVTRFPTVLCENHHRLERATVTKRSREGKTFAFCEECGSKVDLPAPQQPSIGTTASSWLQREEAIARLRNTYETHLANVKGYRRQWAAPRCYLSYVPDQETWAKTLQHDLRDAGIYLVSDAAHVQPDDYVVVLDTPAYQQAWQQPGAALGDDRTLIQSRLVSKKRLLSLVLESKTTSAPSHDLRGCKPGDFCNPSHYPVSLFDLVLNLYAIPFDHAGFAPLRETLHQQWEESLSQFAPDLTPTMKPPKIFISYARADEPHKDKLLKMLSGLKRRGVIDTWDDRLIEPGEEWYPAIHEAINTCHLALLLVSDDFINSGFIYKEEMPRFLERRQAEGMGIIPIIVRPCLWSSEPVLKDLQALPRDGKAVITFDEANGDRDQAWTDIAKAIEKRAKEL
jgi:small GTP-binding protein